MNYGDLNESPSSKTIILPSINPLIDTSVIQIKDTTYFLSNHPIITHTSDIRGNYSVFSTVQPSL